MNTRDKVAAAYKDYTAALKQQTDPVAAADALADRIGAILQERQDDDRMNVQEAADHLRVSKAYLDILRTKGGGPIYAKNGRRVVYERADLDEWHRRRKLTSTSDDGRRLKQAG
jgi:hypothetical protein